MANNPADPESASMEVSETKLVNFAEKTQFDVSKVISGPTPPKPIGNLAYELVQNDLELVNPELELLVGPDGTWNGVVPSFRFKDTKTGEVYSSLSQVPGLNDNGSVLRDLENAMRGEFVPNYINKFLMTLNAQNTEVQSVFQLDPNQLLTVSEGYKVLLKRPL